MRLRQPLRADLLSSYQHMVLACLTGVLLCGTEVPAAGPMLVSVTQAWRFTVIRRNSVPQPDLSAPARKHCDGYLRTGLSISRYLGYTLIVALLGQFFGGSWGMTVAQVSTATGLVLTALAAWQSFRLLQRDPAVW
jgi:hypothetical protein